MPFCYFKQRLQSPSGRNPRYGRGFAEGDTVAVFCGSDEVARGITHYSRGDIDLIKGLHTEQLKGALRAEPPYDTVIHRDNLLVMK